MKHVSDKRLPLLAPLIAAGLLVVVSACGQRIGAVERVVPGGDAGQGREAMIYYGCGSCHTISGVPGAVTQVGPSLNDFHLRHYIAGIVPNTTDNLILWIQHPQMIAPNTAMPDVGVTESEARNMVAYLYGQ